MIRCQNICYSYPNSHRIILDAVEFTIPKGQWVSIIGRNGSGKTTLIKMLNGLHLSNTGGIWIDGELLDQDSLWTIREKVGFVFQNPENQFVGTTVFDDLAFGMENYQIPREEMHTRIDWALKEVDMCNFRYKAPQDLSGGQKQRVALAAILVLRPKIIILDEAMVMLDPIGKQKMLDLLQKLQRKYDMTILSVTHDLSELTYSQRTLVLEEGRLIRDASSSQILQDRSFRMAHGLGSTDMDMLLTVLQDFRIPVKDSYLNEEEWVADLWALFSEESN